MNVEEKISELKIQKNYLEEIKKRQVSRNKSLMGLVGMLVILSLVLLVLINSKFNRTLSSEETYAYSILVIVGLCIYIFLAIIRSWKTNDRISDIEVSIERIDEELELLELNNTTIEQRAEKQFKQHQKELNRYYNENIRHMRGVYNVGIFTITSGLLLIAGTIILCILKSELINDYIVPTMGIVSGLASSLIGTLFIKMYTETINTSSKFHDKLVYSNNLHFNNLLISKVENKDKREDAICEIVKIISENKDIKNN